jgi:hypothetical protein
VLRGVAGDDDSVPGGPKEVTVDDRDNKCKSVLEAPGRPTVFLEADSVPGGARCCLGRQRGSRRLLQHEQKKDYLLKCTLVLKE